jgi:uncharacterized YigZ family protein
MVPLKYKTVTNYAEAEFEDRKSRFIATVKPADTQEEALELISSLKTKYYDATHNVYAYCVGKDSIIQRFSDDGEPSGTAGLPILETIKNMQLRNIVIVVTRYFGGTLLGTGGLVRAYTKSAILGIEASGIITKKLCKTCHFTLEYAFFDRIQSQTTNYGYKVKDIKYKENVEMVIMVPVSEVDKFNKYVQKVTNGRALTLFGESEYV